MLTIPNEGGTLPNIDQFLHNLVSFPVIIFSALDSCFMVDF